MSRRPRVVVVGAGMTGLAAAHELTRGGAEVEVVERAGRPGGAVLTTPFAGVDLDAGPDAFLARVPHAVQLCREVGLGDDLVAPATRNAYLWCGDRLRRFPGGLLLGIPTDLDALASSGIVSPAGVRRAAEDLVRPADGPGPGCDESVADLVRRRLGPEVLNQLVDPLLSGIFAGDTEQLSLLAGVPQIAAAARRDASLLTGARAALDAADLTARHPGATPAPVFLTVRGGLGRLVDALVGELGGLDGLGGLEEPNGGSRPLDAGRLRLATTVEALALSRPGDPGSSSGPGDRADPDGGGDRRLRLRLRPRSGRPAEIEADAVILTIPAPAAGRLVETLAPQAAQRLAAIAYASVTLVSFAYREADVPTPLDGSGFLVPRSAGLLMTACSWASSKFEHLASEGTARLRLSAGRIDDRRADALTDAALLDALRADLATTMGIEAPPLEVRVSRWPASLPQYRVGHLDHLAAVEDDLQRHAPGVVVTGAAFRGVGLPACIDQGRSAAQRILSAFG